MLFCGYFFFGTFAPAFRAFDKPIAIACLRLFTLLPPFPLFSVPRFLSRIVSSTFSDAFLLYLAISCSPFALGTASQFPLKPPQEEFK